MARRNIDLGVLVKEQPRLAAARLRKVLAENRWNLTWTAERLGVNVSTLRRWVAALDRVGLLDRKTATFPRRARDGYNDVGRNWLKKDAG